MALPAPTKRTMTTSRTFEGWLRRATRATPSEKTSCSNEARSRTACGSPCRRAGRPPWGGQGLDRAGRRSRRRRRCSSASGRRRMRRGRHSASRCRCSTRRRPGTRCGTSGATARPGPCPVSRRVGVPVDDGVLDLLDGVVVAPALVVRTVAGSAGRLERHDPDVRGGLWRPEGRAETTKPPRDPLADLTAGDLTPVSG